MPNGAFKVDLVPTGLEAPLSEVEAALQGSARKFAENIHRPIVVSMLQKET